MSSDAASAALEPASVARLLVVIPNWVGDVVLATPVLAALRAHFARAHIAYLLRSYVSEVVAGCGWHDAEIAWPRVRGVRRLTTLDGTTTLRNSLRAGGRFDVGLLLTNSLRSAAVTALAGVARRVGYARDGRGWLLTDRLSAPRRNGEFVPAPVTPYYARIAELVGCPVPDLRLRLGITPAQQDEALALQRHYGLAPRRYAIINPGAAFGAAKCWPPERFAALCDRLAAELDLTPVIVGAPGELPLMRSIAAACGRAPVCCERPGTTLGSLKGLIRDAALLICNDTGPRHYGNAFEVPTVTIFGPTHAEWTRTAYAGEIRLQAVVECGPCQLRTCPLDHRCMTLVSVEMVLAAARRLLGGRA